MTVLNLGGINSSLISYILFIFLLFWKGNQIRSSSWLFIFLFNSWTSLTNLRKLHQYRPTEEPSCMFRTQSIYSSIIRYTEYWISNWMPHFSSLKLTQYDTAVFFLQETLGNENFTYIYIYIYTTNF